MCNKQKIGNNWISTNFGNSNYSSSRSAWKFKISSLLSHFLFLFLFLSPFHFFSFSPKTNRYLPPPLYQWVNAHKHKNKTTPFRCFLLNGRKSNVRRLTPTPSSSANPFPLPTLARNGPTDTPLRSFKSLIPQFHS